MQERGHLTSLTALRFLAALLVFGFHANNASLVPDPLASPAGAGYVGVSFFFVLSGFVLTWSQRAGVSAGRFYWHRFARIWPLYALTTIAVLAIGYAPDRGACSLGENLVLSCALTPGLFINPTSWSIGAEAVFYALFPLVVVLVSRRRRLELVVCAALACELALGLAVGHRAHEFPFVRLGEFVLGVAIATALLRGWQPPSPARAGMLLVAVYLLIAVVGGRLWPWNIVFGLSSAMLIAACAYAEWHGRLRAREWMVQLGQWSFAFYLAHWAVIWVLRGQGAHGVTGFSLTLGCTLALSGLLHSLFERPVERWLRRKVWRRSPVPEPASA